MSDLMRAVDTIRDCAPHYRLAADYYYGTVPEYFASLAVQKYLLGNLTSFNVNFACRPVDAVLDRVEIASITAGEDESATQKILDLVWNANRMGRISKKVHWASLVYGDSYLMAWPNPDNEAEVDLRYKSPMECRVFYSEEDTQKKAFAALMWEEGSGKECIVRVNLFYTDRVERYATAPGSYGETEADFVPYAEDDQEPVLVNPYDEIPIYHFRTNEPYGRPEHRGFWGPQNAITKTIATQMSAIDFSAFPQRYALQAGPEVLDPTYQSLLPGETEDQNPADRESNLTATAGGIWKLGRAISAVGQFAPADQDNFLKPLSFYIRAGASATGTPPRFFDPVGQVPSGEALRADDAPLVAKIRDREEWWEESWNDSLVFASHLVGIAVDQIDIQWRPIETIDDKEGWETALLKQQAGVPVEVTLQQAGYLNSLVDQWTEGGEATNLIARVEILGKIGAAMKDIGAAVTLGVLDQGEAQRVIAELMGEAVPVADSNP